MMEMNCDICGYDLKDEGGFANTGVKIDLQGKRERERVEDIFGKFKFRICHVCWLKSLGVKPKNHIRAG